MPDANRSPRVGVLAVCWREESVILAKRRNEPEPGHWGFPGGKLEFGERLCDGALRELREETGCDGDCAGVGSPREIIGGTGVSGVETVHFILLPVFVRWARGEPVAGDDAAETRWVALDGALPEPRHEGVRAVLRELQHFRLFGPGRAGL